MNIPSSQKLESDFLQQEGWELFLRLQEPSANASDLDRFEQWRGRSPLHLQAALEIEELWIGLDSIRDLPWPAPDEIARDTDEKEADFLPRRWIPVAAALAASLAALTLIFFFLASDTSSFSTGRGEHQLVNLPDGSEIIMGAMSEVTVEYSPARRHIRQTRGEVLFTVSEDPDRPFVVDTPSASVRALGTAFNINALVNTTVVSVVKGTVRVDLEENALDGSGTIAPGSSRELTVSQQISLGNGGILQDVHSANIDDVLAWRSGRFVFSGAPLRRVIEDINRYSDAQVRLGDLAAGELLFTGAIQRTQFETWLSALEASFPVRITRDGTTFVVHSLSAAP